MRYIHYELCKDCGANAVTSVENFASKNLLAAWEDKKNAIQVLEEICDHIDK